MFYTSTFCQTNLIIFLCFKKILAIALITTVTCQDSSQKNETDVHHVPGVQVQRVGTVESLKTMSFAIKNGTDGNKGYSNETATHLKIMSLAVKNGRGPTRFSGNCNTFGCNVAGSDVQSHDSHERV